MWTNFSITSTCTGCGFKAAAEVLKQNGRPNSVWVIVLLSDGLVNMSETSVAYPYGHCNGGLGSFMWSNACIDSRKQWKHIQHDNSIPADGDYTDPGDIDYWGFGDTRFCHPDRVADNNCAPDSRDPNSDLVHHPLEFYSVYDWTLDQVDAFALLKSTNDDEEITGSDVAVYTIGLGDAGLSAPVFVQPRPMENGLLANTCCAIWLPSETTAIGTLMNAAITLPQVCRMLQMTRAVNIITRQMVQICIPSLIKFPPVFIQG